MYALVQVCVLVTILILLFFAQVMDEAKDSVTCIYVTDYEIMTGSADGRTRRYDIRAGEMCCDFVGSKRPGIFHFNPITRAVLH